MFRGMKINQDISYFGANCTQGDMTITTLSLENHFRIQSRTALFRIAPLIQDFWYLRALYSSLPTIRNLSVFMADRFGSCTASS